MRSYLEPTAPIASQALLTDDPKGAMDLATALCDSPRMSNLSHGLWGYGGTTRDGLEVTVQALGIGGPSAAAVVSELAGLGVQRAIRIGSCIALDPALEPGAIMIGAEIEACDGVGMALSDVVDILPHPVLTAGIARITGAPEGTIRSVDLAARARGTSQSRSVSDLSSAAVIATGVQAHMETACALIVAETSSGETLAREDLDKALIALGMRAAEALGVLDQAPGV
ncbi:MAG TPA: hypothetical protein VD766_00380 [Solirubrobacterales bacterium]|nr:hypothetical protein [Solirubrobacterales bacterium]